uniref:Uncharacterized protein n=2 Tax=Arion vulgaris TaxID=1028688 RepID=A0A0B7B6N1_9EUPU
MRKDSHLGSDGDYDDDNSMSMHSERSSMNESFENDSYNIFPSFNGLHKSQSHPNFSIVACNV